MTGNSKQSAALTSKQRISKSELAGEIGNLERLRLNPTGLSTREAYILLALYELSNRRAFSASSTGYCIGCQHGWERLETPDATGHWHRPPNLLSCSAEEPSGNKREYNMTSEQKTMDPDMVHVVTVGAANIYVAKGHLLLIHMHGTSIAMTPAQWIEMAERNNGGTIGG